MRKCVTWRGPSSFQCAEATRLLQEMSQRWRAVGNTVSDLTCPGIELWVSRSREVLVAMQLTCVMTLSNF